MKNILGEMFSYYMPVCDGKSIWFSANNFNGLFRTDVNYCSVEYMGIFASEKKTSIFLHSMIVEYDNNLIFIPFGANSVCVYDKSGKFVKEYKLSNDIRHISSRFNYAFIDKDVLYLIPCRYKFLVTIDLKNGDVNEHQLFEDTEDRPKHPYCLKGACKFGNKIIIGECSKNRIIIFDIDKCVSEEMSLPYDTKGISNIIKENDYWIVGMNGCLVRWNGAEKFEYIEIARTEKERHYGVFYEAISHNGKIYLSMSEKAVVVVFDPITYKFEKVIVDNNVEGNESIPVAMTNMYICNDEIRVLARNGCSFGIMENDGKYKINGYKPVCINKICFSKYGDVNYGIRNLEALQLPLYINGIINDDLPEGYFDREMTY